jgi:hypothetical protein
MRRAAFAARVGAATLALAALLTAAMITRVSAQETDSLAPIANAPGTLAFDSPRYWAAFDTLAELNGVRAEDFRVDPAALELAGGYADRLNLQRYLMAAPLRAPATLESLALELTRVMSGRAQTSAEPRLRELVRLLPGASGLALPARASAGATSGSHDIRSRNVSESVPQDAAKHIASAMELLYVGSSKRFQGRERETVLRDSAALDPRIALPIARVLISAVVAADAHNRILAESQISRGGFLGSRSRATARAALRQLEDAQVETSEELAEDAEITRQLDSVDLAALVAAAVPLAGVLDHVAGDLPDVEQRDFHMEWSTPRGRVAVGGAGANAYRGDYLFVLDLGGDDTYAGPGSVSGEQTISVVLDAGGNDRYAPADSASMGPGGALLGYAAVYDMGEGSDEYTAVRCGGGFGFAGVGWIVDGGGDDSYSMGSWSLGAATRGIGLLIDAGGNDRYDGTGDSVRYLEGFGGTLGVGASIDLSGNDEYLAGAGAERGLSEENHRLHGATICQGAAIGVRPTESGGVGLLIDALGHDTYRAAVASQGAGFRAGVGALVDLAGDDVYSAAGQGEGRAQGIGLLIDVAGDEQYAGDPRLGDGQGNGIDLGLGMLADAAGNDRYGSVAVLGSGTEGGAGFLIDLEGRDECSSDATTIVSPADPSPGVDPLRALFPAVAVFLDLGGEDPHSAELLERLTDSRRGHGPMTFAPRRCLGGALIGNRAFPPPIQ